jgi:hypothetical protein
LVDFTGEFFYEFPDLIGHEFQMLGKNIHAGRPGMAGKQLPILPSILSTALHYS